MTEAEFLHLLRDYAFAHHAFQEAIDYDAPYFRTERLNAELYEAEEKIVKAWNEARNFNRCTGCGEDGCGGACAH